jgi:RNA polymerase sigma factor (sigma-70 family)
MFHSGAEAQDVAQEVFARLLESELAARLDAVAAETLLGWIYRVSGRVAIDYVRTRKRRAALLSESLFAPELGNQLGEGSVDARRVMAALSQEVPAAELEAAILCRVDRLTHEQSAAVLKTSERTVRRHLSRFDERVAGRKKELLK